MKPKKTPDGKFYYDAEEAKRAVDFFPLFLRHLKGGMAGQQFKLLPWQEKITADIFGWKQVSNGRRKYRTVFIAVPRKNGKSTWLAGLGLYMLSCDAEESGEVYGAAYSRDQASIIYDIATGMVEADPIMSKKLLVRKHAKRIADLKTKSVYRVIAADSEGAHGFNASAILFDEVHTQRDRDLWDVLETSTGARTQPLTIGITTAGHDRSSLCWDLWMKARAIIDGNLEDDSFYPVLYAAEIEDDWQDPKVWAKANPSIGCGISLEYLQQQCDRAKQEPAFENTFRRLHLNQWTEQESRIIQMHEWDACQTDIDIQNYAGRTCYAGLDLSTTRDVTASSLVFPEEDGGCAIFPYFWIPKDNIDKRAEKDKRIVRAFAVKGHVEVTDGNEVDNAYIASRIVEITQEFDLRMIGFDPWNATGVTQRLKELGLPDQIIVSMPQTFSTYNEPIKQWITMLGNKKFRHDGNLVFRWMASNAVGKEDANGNLRFDKGSSAEKIDGMTASAMGLALAIRNGLDVSVYGKSGSGVVLF